MSAYTASTIWRHLDADGRELDCVEGGGDSLFYYRNGDSIYGFKAGDKRFSWIDAQRYIWIDDNNQIAIKSLDQAGLDKRIGLLGSISSVTGFDERICDIAAEEAGWFLTPLRKQVLLYRSKKTNHPNPSPTGNGFG